MSIRPKQMIVDQYEKIVEDEEVNEPNKPLPRRKPQLVAPEPRRFVTEGGAKDCGSSAEDLSDTSNSEQLNRKLNSLGIKCKTSPTSSSNRNNCSNDKMLHKI